MKLIDKSTFTKRATVEMSEEEYKVYILGFNFGAIRGFACGVVLCVIIEILIKIL